MDVVNIATAIVFAGIFWLNVILVFMIVRLIVVEFRHYRNRREMDKEGKRNRARLSVHK